MPSSTLYHYQHADGTLKEPGRRLIEDASTQICRPATPEAAPAVKFAVYPLRTRRLDQRNSTSRPAIPALASYTPLPNPNPMTKPARAGWQFHAS